MGDDWWDWNGLNFLTQCVLLTSPALTLEHCFPLHQWLSGFVRECIPLSQKARSAFIYDSVSGQRWSQLHLDPHSCEWSDPGQYKQPIIPLNSFKTPTHLYKQPDHGTEGLYFLKGTQLLLKKAPKKGNSVGLLWVLAGERMALVIEGWLGSVFSPSCWPRRKSSYKPFVPVSPLTQGRALSHLLNLI